MPFSESRWCWNYISESYRLAVAGSNEDGVMMTAWRCRKGMIAMRLVLWWLAASILLIAAPAYGASCPSGQAKDEAALVQMEHTWAQALEKHDVAALDCILASDFEEVAADGQLFDRSHMLNRARSEGPVHYELSEMHGHVYGDAGFVRGVGAAIGEDGKIKGRTRFTDIFVYRDGRWQCVAGQEAMMKEQ
jgi:ketosteroid isomerase-like protein